MFRFHTTHRICKHTLPPQVYRAVLEAAKKASREGRLLGDDEKQQIINAVMKPKAKEVRGR